MIQFNGESYPSMKAWKRAFPIYASYAEFVRDGADSVTKLELIINQRRGTHRLGQKPGQAALRARHKGL